MRTGDVFPTTYTGERTSNLKHEIVIGVDNEKEVETDDNPILEFRLDGSEITLFFKPKNVPIKPKESDFGSEGPDNAGKTHLAFMEYEPLPHVLNVDINAEDELEFLELPHRRSSHVSYFTNFDDLQVGIEFSSKDVVVDVVKWYNIKHRVNFHVTKSQAEK
ncbi:hypothetical protein J1N35_012441 [Gossypium stocksii]|uniref:Uncharacterized protein n=1 Tax=Gossypium stocksii TaxID=47602 RepID=A0A9D4AEF5_9ROSI|nr:hypothetical protein J1N35_012441 [Gossypium stocksii]